MRWRNLHDSPLKFCCAANTPVWVGGPFSFSGKNDWVTTSKAALNPESQSFQRVSARCLEVSWRTTALGWSLYTCGPVCLPAPRCAQQRRRGGISKRAPLYGNGHLFSLHRTAFHSVCVMIMTCKVCLDAHHLLTHTGNKIHPGLTAQGA